MCFSYKVIISLVSIYENLVFCVCLKALYYYVDPPILHTLRWGFLDFSSLLLADANILSCHDFEFTCKNPECCRTLESAMFL